MTYVNGPKLFDLFFKGWTNGFRKIKSSLGIYPDDDTIADNFRNALLGNGIPQFLDNGQALSALGPGKIWQDTKGALGITYSE